jgi:hypothetical protein
MESHLVALRQRRPFLACHASYIHLLLMEHLLFLKVVGLMYCLSVAVAADGRLLRVAAVAAVVVYVKELFTFHLVRTQ